MFYTRVIHNIARKKLVPLSSIDPIELGRPILRLKSNGETEKTPSDLIKRGVIIAKVNIYCISNIFRHVHWLVPRLVLS